MSLGSNFLSNTLLSFVSCSQCQLASLPTVLQQRLHTATESKAGFSGTSSHRSHRAPLNCAMCLAFFVPADADRVPRLLQCGHTLCQQCSLQRARAQFEVKCPVDCQIDLRRADDVPINYAVVGAVELRCPWLSHVELCILFFGSLAAWPKFALSLRVILLFAGLHCVAWAQSPACPAAAKASDQKVALSTGGSSRCQCGAHHSAQSTSSTGKSWAIEPSL